MGRIIRRIIVFIKRYQVYVLAAIVVISSILTILDWSQLRHLNSQLLNVTWIGVGFLISEALFIAGVIIMAVSAGEKMTGILRPRQFLKRLPELKRRARFFGSQLIVSRTFTLGFWLNFIGAIGSSLLLIFGVIRYIPYTGTGLLIVIIIDLIATLSWRIPIEITRRKVRKYGVNHCQTSETN